MHAGTNKVAETRNQSHPRFLSKAGLFYSSFSPILLQSERVMGESLPDLFWSSSEEHEECNINPQKEREGPCWYYWFMMMMTLHFKDKKQTHLEEMVELRYSRSSRMFPVSQSGHVKGKEFRNNHVCWSKIRLQTNNLISLHRQPLRRYIGLPSNYLSRNEKQNVTRAHSGDIIHWNG